MGPTDASEAGLEYALEEHSDATISVVHVTESGDSLGIFENHDPEAYIVDGGDVEGVDGRTSDPNSFSRAQRRRAEAVFERANEIAARRDVEVEAVVRSGEAVSEIVACAEGRDVDRVVIAEHPRTELRPLLRDVHEAVARATDIPVTIVP